MAQLSVAFLWLNEDLSDVHIALTTRTQGGVYYLQPLPAATAPPPVPHFLITHTTLLRKG